MSGTLRRILGAALMAPMTVIFLVWFYVQLSEAASQPTYRIVIAVGVGLLLGIAFMSGLKMLTGAQND